MSAYNTTVPSAVDDATEEPYYRFVSNDNREFKVGGKAIEQSETLHALVGNFIHTKEEREVTVIPLDTCDGTTLDLVFKWCEEYKGKSFPEDESTTPMKIVIPDFDAKLLNIDECVCAYAEASIWDIYGFPALYLVIGFVRHANLDHDSDLGLPKGTYIAGAAVLGFVSGMTMMMMINGRRERNDEKEEKDGGDEEPSNSPATEDFGWETFQIKVRFDNVTETIDCEDTLTIDMLRLRACGLFGIIDEQNTYLELQGVRLAEPEAIVVIRLRDGDLLHLIHNLGLNDQPDGAQI